MSTGLKSERHQNPATEGNARQSLKRRYELRTSAWYRLLKPPLPVLHNPSEAALPESAESVSLWIGAAGQQIPEEFIGVDIVECPGVAIVADVEALPFASQSIGRIECDAVLEHVQNPTKAVQEMLRVLSVGGYLHVVVPFCHPVHLYPADYSRWTVDGLRQLLKDFEVLEIGVRTGPTATLLTIVLEYLKILAPRCLRKSVYVSAGWLLWPFRYMDTILLHRTEAQVLANSIYALARRTR